MDGFAIHCMAILPFRQYNLQRHTKLNICAAFCRQAYALPTQPIINSALWYLVLLLKEKLERYTRLELVTPTLARSCSTN